MLWSNHTLISGVCFIWVSRKWPCYQIAKMIEVLVIYHWLYGVVRVCHFYWSEGILSLFFSLTSDVINLEKWNCHWIYKFSLLASSFSLFNANRITYLVHFSDFVAKGQFFFNSSKLYLHMYICIASQSYYQYTTCWPMSQGKVLKTMLKLVKESVSPSLPILETVPFVVHDLLFAGKHSTRINQLKL